MKKLGTFILFAMLMSGMHAQTDTAYVFKTLKDIETTSVKDQHRSGTCWSFSGLSFVESEILRKGGKYLNLSEMYVVRKCYEYKAEKFIRMHGTINLDAGGGFFDVFWVLKHYGLLPEMAYPGLNYGEDNHVHGELNSALKAFVASVETNKNKKLTTAWPHAVDGILDAYLGEVPESFRFDGADMKKATFTDKYISLDPEDYVSITSFTHHPFYTSFALEIPDNWLWGKSYNVPMEEMAAICKHAVEKGYSVAWGGDVSEVGFSHKRGLAVLPENTTEELNGLERAKWEKLTTTEKEDKVFNNTYPLSELSVNQAIRQEQFDNYQTTDDHGMHITGMVEDQAGNLFYKIKNSWNTNNIYDGYLYMSENYLKLKTINCILHKDALPANIKKKLGIK